MGIAVLSVLVAVTHLLQDRRKLSNKFFSAMHGRLVWTPPKGQRTPPCPLRRKLDPMINPRRDRIRDLKLDQILDLILELETGQIASLRRELAATRDKNTGP
jgi:hypothetical protein